jgi:hypothetical protein
MTGVRRSDWCAGSFLNGERKVVISSLPCANGTFTRWLTVDDPGHSNLLWLQLDIDAGRLAVTTVTLKDVTKVWSDGTVAVDRVSLDVNDGLEEILSTLGRAERKLVGVVLDELTPMAQARQRGRQYA